jgi:protein-disulfide isomerase
MIEKRMPRHTFQRFLFVLCVPFAALPAVAEPLPTTEAIKDRVMGDPNAPVTLIEYASLACHHCADFHANTLPRIKERFIDTGKVKLIFRDFPFDGPAFAAAMTARCAPPAQYFQYVSVFFENQALWSHNPNPREALARIAKLGGMTQDDFDSCVDNKDLFTALRQRQIEAEQQHGIRSTPTFVLGDKTIAGNQPYEVFEKALSEAK